MNKEIKSCFEILVSAQKKLKNADPYGANYKTLQQTIGRHETYLREMLQKCNIANWESVYASLIAQTKPFTNKHDVITGAKERLDLRNQISKQNNKG